MSISWGEAYCESNGVPQTLYKYTAEYSNRRYNYVHIKLYVSVRMRYYSSYFSFRITHAAKVNGVYQDAEIKSTRAFWGHQWEGSYDDVGDFDWWYGSYDYDGSNWHGWYKVFDGDVPVGVDDTSVDIRPCITREPITGPGNPYGTGYPHGTNYLDKTNWEGNSGVWRPWRDTAHIGSWAWSALTQDGCFLNNRNCESLSPAFSIPAYPRPAVLGPVIISPTKVDVGVQETKNLTAIWSPSSYAAGYKVWMKKSDGSKVYLGTTTWCKYSANPFVVFGKNEIFDKEKFSFVVMPYDKNGVEALRPTESNTCEYYEIPSYAPNNGYVIGRKGTKNEILFKGEDASTAKIFYSGMEDGSYPIYTYQLVRNEDGVTVTWADSEGIGFNPTYVTRAIAGVQRPRVTKTWTLKAFNTKNRPCYMKGTTNQWLQIDITYYGGVVYAYDSRNKKWHEGLARVYVDGKWYEADAMFVYKNGEWLTL